MSMFVAITAASLLWALPSGMEFGASTAARGALFALWLREVVVLARDEPKLLDTIMLWTIPGVAAQSALTIVFRISPDIEEQFLRSNLAAIFVGPQAAHLFTDMRNNVLYANKAGGLFVNGNVASLFGGITALVLIVVARRSGRRWLYAVAALSLAGTFFTGSKTALVVGAGCVVATLLLPHMLKRGFALVGVTIVLLGLLTSVGASALLEQVAPKFYTDSSDSLAGREPLWRGAQELFFASPFSGVGFGGWTVEIARFTDRPDLPPHNLILAAWAYSGVVAAILVIAFIAMSLSMGFHVATAQATLRDRRTAMIAVYALAWVFMHGMADNTNVYGEQRSMIIVALALGYLYVMMQEAQQSPSSELPKAAPAMPSGKSRAELSSRRRAMNTFERNADSIVTQS
ncbi:O-antigen ligase family protein [Mycolicibacterium komossense]|uniref:O-antigen ligase family protein n=1 Tax=Mycolicibacterium komossense TaxID=1779 RepID=A0ABT3CDQ3_9MYCO|nr:O-antigen ligase family protein [Mycolicibacterium komossense]MCV7227508.1 O-antigen ligase family protein [Mycolicibacterium komossense]